MEIEGSVADEWLVAGFMCLKSIGFCYIGCQFSHPKSALIACVLTLRTVIVLMSVRSLGSYECLDCHWFLTEPTNRCLYYQKYTMRRDIAVLFGIKKHLTYCLIALNIVQLFGLILCYEPESRGFDTRWGEFLNLPNPSGRTRPWDLLNL
jgi:hypothetical protein